MAKYSEVIEGLKLFMEIEGDKHNVCAEHDIVYAGPDAADTLTDEQRARLEALGWHIDSESGSWARFV